MSSSWIFPDFLHCALALLPPHHSLPLHTPSSHLPSLSPHGRHLSCTPSVVGKHIMGNRLALVRVGTKNHCLLDWTWGPENLRN